MSVSRFDSADVCLCTASVVLYKTSYQMLQQLLESIPLSVCVTLVDNSPEPLIPSRLQPFPRVTYHHVGENLGYGRGHNLGLQLSPPSRFHLIVNPDIIVGTDVIERMCSFMEQNTDVGILSPRFLYGDGSIQYLNRRYPTVLDLVLRHLPLRFLPPFMLQRLKSHEMQDYGYTSACDVECMSGAFMLCRRDILERVEGFDPRYFMYFEDFDLCCSFRGHGFRTVCYPEASVVHQWERSSSREIYMTLMHIRSMIRYFNKWGWRWY